MRQLLLLALAGATLLALWPQADAAAEVRAEQARVSMRAPLDVTAHDGASAGQPPLAAA